MCLHMLSVKGTFICSFSQPNMFFKSHWSTDSFKASFKDLEWSKAQERRTGGVQNTSQENRTVDVIGKHIILSERPGIIVTSRRYPAWMNAKEL